jgi:hypothetical protein
MVSMLAVLLALIGVTAVPTAIVYSGMSELWGVAALPFALAAAALMRAAALRRLLRDMNGQSAAPQRNARHSPHTPLATSATGRLHG